jgi:hypothetical protein
MLLQQQTADNESAAAGRGKQQIEIRIARRTNQPITNASHAGERGRLAGGAAGETTRSTQECSIASLPQWYHGDRGGRRWAERD